MKINLIGPKRKEDYQPIALVDTKDMPEKEWLKWRDTGIGGSDISTIFNVSPWKTPLELFHERTGVEPAIKKEFNTNAKRLGHIYEAAISEVFLMYMEKEEPKLKIEKIADTVMYRHGKKKVDGSLMYPWAQANLDYRIKVNGQMGILEIKRTSSRNIESIEKWKNGICPIYYELQCRYYMSIMNLQFCYICCSWGHQLDEMAVILITRDYEVENKIMSKVEEFWDCCEQGFEPDVSECKASLLNDYYSRLYGQVNEKAPIVELPVHYAGIFLRAQKLDEEIVERKRELADAEERKEEIYKELYPLFGKSAYGTCRISDDQVACITLKTSLKRAKLDLEKLKVEHPDVYDKYLQETFDESEFKKKEKKLKLEYELPKEVSDDPNKKNTFSLKMKDIPITN